MIFFVWGNHDTFWYVVFAHRYIRTYGVFAIFLFNEINEGCGNYMALSEACFLKTGANGWRDSGPPGYLKPKCILISINIAIAWITETVKFWKLKKWQHFEIKISIFLVLFFWMVKKKKKK